MSEPLNIAICENLKADSDFLARKIKETGAAVKICFFENGEAFLENYQKGLYHLVYLDIFMSDITGVAVAAAIRERGDETPVAFITISEDYALEANKYRSILYVVKPVTTEAVAHTLNIAEAVRQQRKKDILSVTDSERKKIDIPFADIIYIEVLNHRCTVHLSDGGEIKVRTSSTIDELDALLPRPRFFRSHRSFIVNFDYVERTDTDFTFIMSNGDKALVRIKDFDHIKKMKKEYEDYLFAEARREY